MSQLEPGTSYLGASMLSMRLPAQRHRSRVRGWWFLLFVAVLLPLGCGEKLPPLAPVKGTVSVDGKNLTAGQVSLVLEKVDPDVKVPPSSGKIESDGTYEIFTGGKSGAPLAKYKFVVSPDMTQMGGPGKMTLPFNEIYRDSTRTTLKFEVIDSPEAGRYDLKLKK